MTLRSVEVIASLIVFALLASCSRETAPVQTLTLEDCGEIGRWSIVCDAHVSNCRCVSTQVRP